MSGADIAGCLGLALLIVALVVLTLPWSDYRTDEWGDDYDRRQNEARLAKDIDQARAKNMMHA